MTDDTARPRPRLTRNTKIVLALVALVFWTVFAGQWDSKGCTLFPQSYSLVLFHGTPDRWEGCEEEPYGPTYTDDYGG